MIGIISFIEMLKGFLVRNNVIKCVLYLILSLSINAYTQVDMEILPGFDGYHKHGCWLPLRITLTSSGENVPGAINWEIYESDTDSLRIYSKPVKVFDMAKNIQYLYVFPEIYRRNLSIKFVDDNGKELTQKDVSLKTVSPDERLIVVVSENAGGLEFLSGMNPVNYISYVTRDLLPDSWKGYDSVDAMVLGNFSLSDLSDNQQQAIKDWIYNGGCLIVSGGAYSQGLSGTFLDTLLPVRTKSTSVLDSLEPLSQRYGHDISKTRTVVAFSELADRGEAIMYKNGLPLIAKRRSGYGKAIFLAFDYLDPAIRSWEGKKEMWREILPEPTPHDYSEDRDISRILLATNYKGPFSYKWAGLLFLLYILCFLIVNRFMKRTGKALLIWLGIPATSIVFTIVALGFNYNLKGQTVIINDLSVVDLYQESGRGKITSYFGLFSPANRDYKLNFPEAIFLRDIQLKDNNAVQRRDYRLIEDEIFELKMSKSRILKPALFRAESYIELDGRISLKLDEGLGGKVASELPFDLSECYVFSNGYRAYIGDLEHGKTVNIDTSGEVPATHSKMGGEKQRFFNSMRQKLSESITGKGLIGWADESALRKFLKMNMDVEYKTVGTMLVIVHI